MNNILSALYSQVISAFYGIGGVMKLSAFMDAFEQADKKAFDIAMANALLFERESKKNG